MELVSVAAQLGDDGRTAFSCALVLRNIGEHKQALEMARRADELSQGIPPKAMLVGCLIVNGLASDARRELDILISRLPPGIDTPVLPLNRDYHILLEDWQAALPFAERCTNQEGPEFLARIKEALILAELDRFDEAEQAIETARSLLPKLKLHRSVPGLAMSHGHLPQFYRGIEKLIERGVE